MKIVYAFVLALALSGPAIADEVDDAIAAIMDADGPDITDGVDLGDTGTPDAHGDREWFIEHGTPGSDDVYGDDEWENGPREPWSCATADMERDCHPVYDDPDFVVPEPGDPAYEDWSAWNDSE